MNNPLLESHILPPFDAIQTEHILPAIETLLKEARSELQEQLKNLPSSPSWDDLVAPVEARADRLNQAWSPVGHLNAVCSNEALREAHDKAQLLLTDYYTELGQNEDLYRAYVALKDSDGYQGLSKAQKKTIDNALRDFKLSGVALEPQAKKRYSEIQSRLSTLNNQFSNNVLDATHGWFKQINDEAELAGLPEFAVAGARKAAESKNLEGWVLTLDVPVYLTVMTQSDNADLRKAMYQAFNTRASDYGPQAGRWDNSPIMGEILQLRQELARLLEFNNYAEYSIEAKMAESTEQVLEFLYDLAQKAKPIAEKDMQALRDFAREEYAVEQLDAWDIPYYSEKLKQARYSISQEALRPYFPAETVIAGLFKVANRLFNIDFVEKTDEVAVWHESVRYYEIRQKGEPVAGFYFDLFAREGKRGGAWMDECRVRRRLADGSVQLPVAYLVCNFNPPVGDKPSLLTHNEVTTTFHEFGHGIHHMLTKIDVAAVSGIRGVAWDAVELPSQFMENFCWEPEVLAFLSSHYESQEPLPEEQLNNMLAAKNFQAAMFMLRQLEFSIFDFRLHMEYGEKHFAGIQGLLEQVRDEIAVFLPPPYHRFQHSFSHIFAGGYAAGYYSYKWAEVLSADAYSAFEEAGIFDRETGERYLREILQRGGSEDAMQLFKKFRGREPEVDALLRHSGIAA